LIGFFLDKGICQIPIDVFEYYGSDVDKYAKIWASGLIIKGDDICVSSQIEIVEELTKDQMLELTHGLFKRFDGTKEWYLKGVLHREDGPAIEDFDGNKEWYFEGKRHRLDGPAVEWSDGTKMWF
jgi:hypothetical protein